MPEIRHLSLSVQTPENCARRLAALTLGKARPFMARHLAGAWICLWDPEKNSLIEFIPIAWKLVPGPDGALFVPDPEAQTGASHIQLALACSPNELEERAAALDLPLFYRERFGGPLWECWLEPGCLIEFLFDPLLNPAAS